MNSCRLLSLQFTIVACVVLECSGDWWMEEPYQTDSFNVRCEYGENTSIFCEDHRYPSPDEIQYWILPDLTVMNRTDYKDFQTLDGMAGWSISPDGISVEVFLVQERHFGFYYCVFSNRSTGGVEVIKKGLNYKGPYVGDLWEIYEMPVIIGSVAAGVCVILFTVVCIIYEVKCNRENETDVVDPPDCNGSDDRHSSVDVPVELSFDNAAYVEDYGGFQISRRKTEEVSTAARARNKNGAETMEETLSSWL